MSDTKPDLDALDEVYHRGGQPTMDEGKALVAYARTLEAKVEQLGHMVNVYVDEKNAAEAERDLLRDTLARRSVAHDRLVTRLDQVRAIHKPRPIPVNELGRSDYCDADGMFYPCATIRALGDVLDGDQRTEAP